MKNLLRDSLSLADLTAILRQSPPVALLPAEGDAQWQSASQKPVLADFLAHIQQRTRKEIDAPMPLLTDALYGEFSRTGTRINFETLWFEKRRRLARAAVAVLTESDPAARQKFRGSLQQKAADIMGEESWPFPAHVGDPSGKDPTTIDLFAAETANLFAELLAVFPGAGPDAWAAGFVAAVRQRLRAQFFENYLAHDPRWVRMTNNWNAVCHQGVVGAALTIEEDADLLCKMLFKMRQHLPLYLAGYSADGATAEGPGYWSYGFGWFTELNAQLEKRTRGELSLFHDDPLIPKIARFGPALVLTDDKLVNFSDAGPHGALRAGLLQYLAERLQDPIVQKSADYFWDKLAHGSGDKLDGQRSDFFCYTRMILRSPSAAPAAAELPIQDSFFPGLGWIVTRSRDDHGHLWEFAAKAGNNEEHHNHNDVGSYLLNIDGQRVLLEIGSPEYVKDFFRGETRYGFFAARSLGHSVPLINGCEQPAGKQFCGEVIEQSANAREAIFVVDFTKAYPPEAGLMRGIRRIMLDKRAGILRVRDDFRLTAAHPVDTGIILGGDVRAQDGAVVGVSGPVRFRIVPEEGTVVGELQQHEYKDHQARRQTVTRVSLVPAESGEETSLAYAVEILP